MVCTELTFKEIVESIKDTEEGHEHQADSDEESAEEPKAIRTREVTAACEALQHFLASLPDLVTRHAVTLSIGSAVVASSIKQTIEKKITNHVPVSNKHQFLSVSLSHFLRGDRKGDAYNEVTFTTKTFCSPIHFDDSNAKKCEGASKLYKNNDNK